MWHQHLGAGLASFPSALQQVLSASNPVLHPATVQPLMVPPSLPAPMNPRLDLWAAQKLQPSLDKGRTSAYRGDDGSVHRHASSALQRPTSQSRPMPLPTVSKPAVSDAPLKQHSTQQQQRTSVAAAPPSSLHVPSKPNMQQRLQAQSTAAASPSNKPSASADRQRQQQQQQGSPSLRKNHPPTPAAAAEPARPTVALQYQWRSVQRAACKKGCKGPILQSIKRMGRMGRKPPPSSGQSRRSLAMYKEPNCIYLSIDEAATHVGARTFRSAVECIVLGMLSFTHRVE